MIFAALWCAGLAAIGLSVKWVALNAFLPVVAAITSQYTPSQVGTVGMSIALALVALTGAFALVSRLTRNVRMEILHLIAPTIARTDDRLTRLENCAADRESVQSGIRGLETRIVVLEPVPPDVKTKADMERHALLKLLGTTSVENVGPLPDSDSRDLTTTTKTGTDDRGTA